MGKTSYSDQRYEGRVDLKILSLRRDGQEMLQELACQRSHFPN